MNITDGGTGFRIRYKISSNLGKHWDQFNRTVTAPTTEMVMSMITDYIYLSASSSNPQFGFKKGLEIFEEDGYKATLSKLQDNLIGRGCVKMLNKNEVTSDVWKNTLAYLMFLKRKRSWKVKASGCANGQPKREYISKDNSSSHTVSIYALMVLCVMSAMEKWKVVLTIEIKTNIH